MYNQEEVDKYFPNAHIYEPMKVFSIPKNKNHKLKEICESGEYFAQLKKDGNWFAACTTKDKIYMFGRGVSVTNDLPVECSDKVPHITEALKNFPEDSFIIGELYYPDENTNAVRTILGCKTSKALERQKEKGYLHFYVYDIIRYNGEDLTNLGNLERYNKLVEVFNKHIEYIPDFLELAEVRTDNLYEYGCEALGSGEEGIVLKKKTDTYKEGKKPAWNNVKWKKHDTLDVICMGFCHPTKEYKGIDIENWEYWETTDENGETHLEKGFLYPESIKNPSAYCPVTKPYYRGVYTAIEIGLYNDKGEIEQIGTISSGLTDELRECLSSPLGQTYINKVIECDCMELTDEAIRHPSFLRFRDDKPKEECKMSEIFKK